MLNCLKVPRASSFSMLLLVTVVFSTAPAAAAVFQVQGDLVRKRGNEPLFTSLDSYDATSIVANGVGREVIFDDTAGAPNFTYKASAAAVADIAGLGSHTFSKIGNQQPAFLGEFQLGASSAARGRYDDVMISGPAGVITTSLNFSLEGSLIVVDPGLFIGSSAHANVQIEVRVNDQPVGFGLLSMIQQSQSLPQIEQAVGMLQDWRNFGTITTPSFVVPTNNPFSVKVSLQTGTSVRGFTFDPFEATANSGFLGTLTFAIDRPVFNLLPNYTANSVDAGITDNSFAAVPEPSTFVLAGCGIIAMGAYAVQRERSSKRRIPRPSMIVAS